MNTREGELVEPIDLANVRRYRAWVANADLVFPILDAIEQVPPDEKKVRLFWGACRIREIADERGLSLKRLWPLLRAAGSGFGSALPYDEVDRTISAGFFKGKHRY